MGHFSVPNIYAHIWMWSVIWTFVLTCLRIGISMSIGIGHTIWRQHKNETSFLAKWAVFLLHFLDVWLQFLQCNCNRNQRHTFGVFLPFFVIHSIFFCRFLTDFGERRKLDATFDWMLSVELLLLLLLLEVVWMLLLLHSCWTMFCLWL